MMMAATPRAFLCKRGVPWDVYFVQQDKWALLDSFRRKESLSKFRDLLRNYHRLV